MRTIRSVHFPLQEVTSISRPPNEHEMSLVSDFDRHVGWCRACSGGTSTHGLVHVLCSRGKPLAARLVEHLVGSADGRIYSNDRWCTQFERIEVPIRYQHVHRLFVVKNRKTKRDRGNVVQSRTHTERQKYDEITKTGLPEYTVVFRSSRRPSRSTIY